MLISSSKTTFKELELIISEDCVIFPKSLIGATIQDSGKRERRNLRFTALYTIKIGTIIK